MKRTCLQGNTIEDQCREAKLNTDEQNSCEFYPVEILLNEHHFDPKDNQFVKSFVRVKRIKLFILLLVVFESISILTNAQEKMSRANYIETFKILAIKEMHRSGIPASITMAQGCLESSNGNSELAVQANNHFGIKCKGSWTGEKSYHNDDEKNECFRKYATVFDSYDDHTTFLVQGARYKELFEIDRHNYKAWAHGLKKAGYATDPAYADRLIKIIEDEELWRLDEVDPGDFSDADIDLKKVIPTVNKRAEKLIKQKMDKFEINPYSKRKITKINDLKSVMTYDGDTFEGIAQELETNSWELMLYNDYKKGDEPRPNTTLYLQRKHFSALKGKEYHVVKESEDMWLISQKYGIKLSSLYRKNRMEIGTQPRVGERLYLRSRKPKK